MNYTEAIAYLEEVASFGIHPGLERITALLEELGNPQNTYKTIHVTGTNGKGSVSTYITYGLYMSGLRVGTFTSPHLQSYTERMRVNTAYITEEAFADLIERVSHAVKAIIDRGVEAPTQFEILTAAAFLFFQEQGVDYAVIEVGLGGLLDSTNVITPEVAVITNVTIDHQAYCGDTVEEIARHKAGIIKQGVPLVTAAQGGALDVIKETAKSLGVKYHVFNEDFTIDSRSAMAMGQMITVKDKDGHKDMLFTSMHGIHQALNLACAARVLQILKDKEPAVSEETYREGLARAIWPGRFETFKVHGRTIILDGAHNASGAEAFSMTFNELYPEQAKTVVLSILEDKDISTMVSYLVGQKDRVITVPAPTPRGTDPVQLAKQMPVQAEPMETIQEGLDHAMKITKEGDIIAVVGSLYILVAGLLALLFDRQRFSGTLHWLQWAVLVFVLWTGISIVNSMNVPWSAMSWFYHIGMYGSIYWLMTYYIDNEMRQKTFLSLFCITGVLVCVGAGYQYFYMTPEHIHEWVDNVHFPGLMRRMYGTLQNPNLLGEYLLFTISIGGLGTMQVLKAKDWKRSAMMGFAVAVMLLCLVLTYSRGMWLSLAVAVFVAGICVERRLLYALLAVPLVLFFYHGEVSSRLWSLFSGQDTSVMLRWALWDSTMYMIEDFPIFGIGWDTFWMTYPDYNYFIQDPTVIIYHAHNLYLQVAAETGPISLCLLLAILLGHSRNVQKQKHLSIPFRYGMTLITVVVLVSGLFDHALYSQQVSLVLWQFLGFAMSVIRNKI